MPVAPGPSKRFVILLVVVSFALAFIFVSNFRSQPIGVRHPNAVKPGAVVASHVDINPSILTGHAIAPKLGNETAKYVACNRERKTTNTDPYVFQLEQS